MVTRVEWVQKDEETERDGDESRVGPEGRGDNDERKW